MFIIILIFLFFDEGSTCQPPMAMPPVAFQSSGMPIQMPASPPFNPALPPPPSAFASAAVSSLDQRAPPPPPPLPMNEIGNEQLEIINAPVQKMTDSVEVTPYPGYIAPPPAPSYPTLIEESDESQGVGSHFHQQSSNTYRSEVPLQLLSDEKRDYNCHQELTTFTDFLTCVRRLSTVTLDEHNLNCTFEKDSGCRFKSISNPLSVGNFPTIDHYRTFATLASRPESQTPTGNFVFFIEHRGTDPEDEFIVSTPIICQKGNGVLKFDYWIVGKQSEVLLRVCTQNHIARSCTQTIAYNSPQSSISIEVVHPNTTFFELEIVASNLLDPTIIVYDNIKYDAELCEWDEKDEDEDVVRPIASVDSFFDGEDQDERMEQSIEKRDEDSINTEELSQEVGVIGETEEPLTIPVRPIRLSPKRVVDQSLASEITELTTDEDEDPKSLCKLLDCNFNNDTCAYANYDNDTMSIAPWNIGSDKIGNPHTGVRDGSGFLYVGTDSPASSKIMNYILESPDLSIDEDFRLALDVYRRSNDITLQICLDTPFYCPYSIAPFNKENFWSEGESFMIPKGTFKIYLKAIQWRRFKWLAVDNIRVISNKCGF